MISHRHLLLLLLFPLTAFLPLGLPTCSPIYDKIESKVSRMMGWESRSSSNSYKNLHRRASADIHQPTTAHSSRRHVNGMRGYSSDPLMNRGGGERVESDTGSESFRSMPVEHVPIALPVLGAVIGNDDDGWEANDHNHNGNHSGRHITNSRRAYSFDAGSLSPASNFSWDRRNNRGGSGHLTPSGQARAHHHQQQQQQQHFAPIVEQTTAATAPSSAWHQQQQQQYHKAIDTFQPQQQHNGDKYQQGGHREAYQQGGHREAHDFPQKYVETYQQVHNTQPRVFFQQPLMDSGQYQHFYNHHSAMAFNNANRGHVEMQAPLIYVAQSSIKNDSPDSTPEATPPHLIEYQKQKKKQSSPYLYESNYHFDGYHQQEQKTLGSIYEKDGGISTSHRVSPSDYMYRNGAGTHGAGISPPSSATNNLQPRTSSSTDDRFRRPSARLSQNNLAYMMETMPANSGMTRSQQNLPHQHSGMPADEDTEVYMAFTSHFGTVMQEPNYLVVHVKWDYWIMEPYKQYSIGLYVDRKEQEGVVNFELICAFDTNEFGQFGVSGLKNFQNCRPLPQPNNRFLALVHPTDNPYEIRVINHFEKYDMMKSAGKYGFSPSGHREFSFGRLRKPMEHFNGLEMWVQQIRGMRAFFMGISPH